MLGSLRFSINAFTQGNEEYAATAKAILTRMAPLFFRESSEKVHEISLCFSPKEIRKPAFREKYVNLKEYLSGNGIEPAQGL